MSPITTHVLDTAKGRPAIGIEVVLQIRSGQEWMELGKALTDANGRCSTLMKEEPLNAGTYRLLFRVATYYQEQHVDAFYSEIPIMFEVTKPEAHYHVPLLISPFGYSTYRGS